MTFRVLDINPATLCPQCGSTECVRQLAYETMAEYLRKNMTQRDAYGFPIAEDGELDYVVSAYEDAVEMCRMEARKRNRSAL